jgi:Fe-S-cluster containining protein
VTECTRCGDCCEGFPLNTPERADVYGRKMLAGVGSRWLPPKSNDGAMRKQWAWMANLEVIAGPFPYRETDKDGKERVVMRWRYSCPIFDSVARLCSDHTNRPPVCRKFPWYGRDPKEDSYKNLPARCSFVADTGDVKMLPIVEVRHGHTN